MLFEPVDRLGVEVVGRLVEQQHIGLLEQQAAKSHAATLATREGVDLLVVGRALKGIHSALQFGVDIPGIGGVERILQLGLTLDEFVHLVGVLKHVGVGEGGIHLVEFSQQVHYWLHAFAHNLDYGLPGVELRLLLQVAYRISGGKDHLALIIFVDAGDNLQQRRLTRAVQTDNADFGTVEE